MELNILTFREWNENHVKVNFILDGAVEVYSFGKLVYKSRNKETIQRFKDYQNTELLKFYKKNFDDIQDLYDELIDNLDFVS